MLARALVHLVFGSRGARDRELLRLLEPVRGAEVLEIGSGRESRLSVEGLFHPSNKVTKSDVDPSFGHMVIDVATMDVRDAFDVVVCLNVLEHVYDFHEAAIRMHAALRANGTALVAVPAMYPLHDEPGDYWRFTEHALRRLFGHFDKLTIRYRGVRKYPLAYLVQADKGSGSLGR